MHRRNRNKDGGNNEKKCFEKKIYFRYEFGIKSDTQNIYFFCICFPSERINPYFNFLPCVPLNEGGMHVGVFLFNFFLLLFHVVPTKCVLEYSDTSSCATKDNPH